MKSVFIVVIVGILAGCATASQSVGPNGGPAYSIACGAAVPHKCLEKAGQVCPNGYTVLNRRDSEYLGQHSSVSVRGYAASGSSAPMNSLNSLLVECKAPR